MSVFFCSENINSVAHGEEFSILQTAIDGHQTRNCDLSKFSCHRYIPSDYSIAILHNVYLLEGRGGTLLS